MLFKVRYYKNPLTSARPRDVSRGEHLLSRGLYNLKRKIKKPWLKLNPDRNAKCVIHGLAYLHGFKYRKFMTDNFEFDPNTKDVLYLRLKTKTKHIKRKCTLSYWCLLIRDLNSELLGVSLYKNMSSLLRSRYAKCIQISNINRYYHPRKKRFASHARTALEQLGDGSRHQFIGTYKRFGSKPNGQLTILLLNIISPEQHRLVTDHLWFNATKQFRSLGRLTRGDRITFRARVKRYWKGFLPDDFVKRYDYKLNYPTQVKLLKEH